MKTTVKHIKKLIKETLEQDPYTFYFSQAFDVEIDNYGGSNTISCSIYVDQFNHEQFYRQLKNETDAPAMIRFEFDPTPRQRRSLGGFITQDVPEISILKFFDKSDAEDSDADTKYIYKSDVKQTTHAPITMIVNVLYKNNTKKKEY